MKIIFYTFLSFLLSVSLSAQSGVDIIVNSDDHNTLEAAVITANLAGTLFGDDPFTEFAPTDDGFALLPEGTLESLLDNPSGAHTDILLNHVVVAFALSIVLVDGQFIMTLNSGEQVQVIINDDRVMIVVAIAIVADIVTDNGVVHVIDDIFQQGFVSTTDLTQVTSVSLHPNPAVTKMTIDICDVETEVLKLEVYDV